MTPNRATSRMAAVVATVLVSSWILSGCSSVAAASCAAPTAKLSSSEVKAGGEVTLTGDNFIEVCEDTGGGPNTPATRIAVTFTDDSAAASKLTTVHADDKGHIETVLTIPADVDPGSAEIRVGSETTVPVMILTP